MQPYGSPPGPYGWQQPQMPMHAQPQPPPPPKSGAGAIVAVILLLVLLLGGAAVAAGVYYFVIKKPAPHLARYAPKNASIYVELPSFQHSMLSAASMKPLDSSHIDEKQMKQDLVLAFSNAFDVTQDDARAVVNSLDASAFVARDSNHRGDAAMLVSFSTNAPEKLFKTGRFATEGPFLGGGMRYTLEKKLPSQIPPNASLFELALSEMATTHGTPSVDLVWYPNKKLLVFGDDPVVTDIGSCVAGNVDALETAPSYKAAKKTFESGSDLAFYWDTHDLDDVRDPDGKKTVDGWLHDRDPLTGAVKLVKAGVMIDAHASLTGSNVPPEDLISPAKLTYPHRLPADTVAYMAMSTKTKLSGATVRGWFVRFVSDLNAYSGKELGDALTELDKSLGFKVDDVLDMTGDETAIGVVLDPAFKLDTTNGITDELPNIGLVYALAIKDDAKARMVLGKIRGMLEDPSMTGKVKVTPIGADGFEADPETSASFPLPNLTVKYDGKQIVAVVASPAMTTRAFAALQGGTATLATNPAHELALDAMPKDAHFYTWIDTGRITSVMMDAGTHMKSHRVQATLPLDAVRLTGPDRVTSAIAMRWTHKPTGGWAVDYDSLNMPALGLFSIAADLDLESALPRGGVMGGKTAP